jgi:hypothetical protein
LVNKSWLAIYCLNAKDANSFKDPHDVCWRLFGKLTEVSPFACLLLLLRLHDIRCFCRTFSNLNWFRLRPQLI